MGSARLKRSRGRGIALGITLIRESGQKPRVLVTEPNLRPPNALQAAQFQPQPPESSPCKTLRRPEIPNAIALGPGARALAGRGAAPRSCLDLGPARSPPRVAHVGAQDGVHTGLVAGALLAEPGDDVAVEAEGQEFLGFLVDRDGIEVAVLWHVLPVGVGGDCGFQLLLGRGAQGGSVGAAFAAGARAADFVNRIAPDSFFVCHGGRFVWL